jgi:hypothetical protein
VEVYVKRRTWLLGIGLAAVAAVVGIGVVMAQEDGATTGTSFLDRVAAKLGIDTPRLEQAITDARTDEINERVADGDLTQEQADRLLERMENLPEDGFAPFGGQRFGIEGEFGFKGGHGFAFGGPWLGLIGPGEELATFLGIPQEQLLEELSADGATLTSVAEAHGKSRDELKAFILDAARTRLDEAVANGSLTRERADEILGKLESAVDAKIDAEVPFKFEHRFEFGPDGDDQDGDAEPGGVLDSFFRS